MVGFGRVGYDVDESYIFNLILTSLAQWIELSPTERRVRGSNPLRGTFLIRSVDDQAKKITVSRLVRPRNREGAD